MTVALVGIIVGGGFVLVEVFDLLLGALTVLLVAPAATCLASAVRGGEGLADLGVGYLIIEVVYLNVSRDLSHAVSRHATPRHVMSCNVTKARVRPPVRCKRDKQERQAR